MRSNHMKYLPLQLRNDSFESENGITHKKLLLSYNFN